MDLMPGVVIGIVKRLDDQTGEGRIQVEYPWLGGEQRSGWAPVAAPLAGKGRGAFFMPEPEDEVLLAFEQGYTDHPFIVGFLWNGRDRPPETERENRVIRTPGGHELRFEDKDGARKVVLVTSLGHRIELDDTLTGNFIQVKTKLGLSLTLDDKQSAITLAGGGRTLTMQAGQLRIT
jgi:uncharacterized protein involved in type VI secretion and phage assembly